MNKIKKYKILALIPARSGSKRIKNKNIKLINNKPLIYYTINTAIKSKCFDKIIVSTDSKKIASISKKFGANVPFIRPKKFSGDKDKINGVVNHCLNYFIKLNIRFDIIVLLQPTQPLRSIKSIKESINKIKLNRHVDSVISATECGNSHPNYIFNFKKNNKLNYFKKNPYLRSQQFNKYYYRNGSIYCFRSNLFFKTKKIHNFNSTVLITPFEESINIDDHIDFEIAEKIMLGK